MTVLAIFLAVAGGVLYCLLAVAIGRFCSLSNPPEPHHETDGEWEELKAANTRAFWAEMEARAARAEERRARWQQRDAA